ncbi:MAG: hypothetical protein AB1626_00685 [Candidatus Micrarchaeota archaeon]
MRFHFEARLQKKKKYDYHQNKKYAYEQAFVIIPNKIAKKIKAGKTILVSINFK